MPTERSTPPASPERQSAPIGTRAIEPAALARLRTTVLDAWAASPARFREDANAEEALHLGGYADRVVVELAANGVDAARQAGVPARLRISVVDGELRVANTGAGLTLDGVGALASLRASAKRDDEASVGHFGVGFTAVLSVADAVRVVSTTGGVAFDRDATAAAVTALDRPELTAELDARSGYAPALRLPWPLPPQEPPPPDGYDTEVRLTLRPDVDPVAVMATAEAAVDPLFWALPDLVELTTPRGTVRRRSVDDATGPADVVELVRTAPDRAGPDVEHGDDDAVVRRFLTVTRSGRWDPALLHDRPIEERHRLAWRLTWVLPAEQLEAEPVAVPMLSPDPAPADDRPAPIGAPTPTDELLDLPARLIATFPVDDTRRGVVAGPLTDHLLEQAAQAYLDLVAAVDPGSRWQLVPPGGFPVGELDGRLRALVVDGWHERPLLVTAAGDPVTPRTALLVQGLRSAAAGLLVDAVPGLLRAPGSAAEADALRRLGVRQLAPADLIAALGGISRPPAHWREIYAAVAELDTEGLAGLPVPLVDGRQVLGPRGRLLPGDDGLAARAGVLIPGLPVVHPDAVHPVLLRLGSVDADPDALLSAPATLDELRSRFAEFEDGPVDGPPDLDPDDDDAGVRFAELIGDLIAAGGRAPDRRLEVLLLSDDDDLPCPVGELVLRDAPVLEVLGDALAVVGQRWVRRWGRDTCTALGVRDGFPVVAAFGEPADLVDDLPDLDEYAAGAFGDGDPAMIRAAVASGDGDGGRLVGLADLDLVPDGGWPAALSLIAADRAAREAVVGGAAGSASAVGGAPSYAAWWIRTFAEVDGRPLTDYRMSDAAELAGLYDPLPVRLDHGLAAALGVRSSLRDAATADPVDLLRRLADPDRHPGPAAVATLTAAVVEALESRQSTGGAEPELPARVRSLGGTVVAAEDALVPDGPWWAQVLDPAVVVAPGADPERTAEALQLALASEEVDVTLPPAGRVREPNAAERAAIDRAAASVSSSISSPKLLVMPALAVGIEGRQRPVTWWPAGEGTLVDGSPEGIGRAVAWVAGRWSGRHRAVAAAAEDVVGVLEDDFS